MNFLVVVVVILFLILIFKWVNRKKEIKNKQKKIKKILKIINDQTKKNIVKQKVVFQSPPEFIKLNDLLFDFTRTNNWNNLILIGNMYKNGAYPRFKNNEILALECFKIAARSPDSEIAGIAQLKCIEIMNGYNKMNSVDNIGDDLPEYYGKKICNIALDIINNTPYNFFKKPKNNINNDDNDRIIHQVIRPHPQMAQRINNNNNNNNNNYKNDMQNVHDHGVTNILKSNIDMMKTNNKIPNSEIDTTVESVTDSILNHSELSDNVKANALTVIENLNNVKHDTYNLTEQEALHLVWNRIQNVKDETLKNNMIETLSKQLDSGIEHGHIVCSSGKIARIIGSLDGIDNNIENTRPIWAIRAEIGNLASKLRNNKKEFEHSVKKTYIDDLKMNPSIIQPIIDEYIEFIDE